MAAGSIVVSLLLATGSFSTDLDRESKAFKRKVREMEADVNKWGARIGAAFAVAGTAVAYFVKSAIDSADAAGKVSQAAGLTTESFTALQYAAGLAGVENDALAVSLNKLNKNISENDKAFKEIGISVTTTSGQLKTADAVLSELADKFAAMPDGPRKSQLAIDLLGKSGAALIPLLNAGSAGIKQLTDEAARMGVVIDTQTAKSAEEFNDNLTRLHKTAQGLALAVAKDLLPGLENLSRRMVENIQQAGFLRGAFISLYEVWFGGTGPADVAERQNQDAAESIKLLRREIELLTSRGMSEGFQGGVLGQLREELARLEKQSKLTRQSLADALNEQAGRTVFGRGVGFKDPRMPKIDFSGDKGPAAPKAGGGGPKVSEAERYLEQLQKQLQSVEKMTVMEKLLDDIQNKRIGGLTPKLEAQLKIEAGRIDAMTKMAELTDIIAKNNAAALKPLGELERDLEGMVKTNEQLRQEIELMGYEGPARIERARALEREAIARLELDLIVRKSNGATQEEIALLEREIELRKQHADLIAKRDTKAYDLEKAKETDKAIVKTKTLAEELGLSFTSAFEDAIVGGKGLRDLLKGLEQDIIRIVTRKLVTEPLSNAIGGIFGGGGGMPPWVIDESGAFGGGHWSGLSNVGSSGGGIMDFFSNLFRADGGPVSAGRGYIVGERGPEWFQPNTAGAILPAHATAKAAGGNNINVTIAGNPNMGRDAAMQQGLRIGRGIQMAMSRNG